MKKYIRAMSDTRKNIAAKLDDSAYKVIEHLIKVFCYPDSDARNHWVSEIYAGLHHVSRLKSSNKYPNAKFIFDSMWSMGNDKTFHIQYDNVVYEYGESKIPEGLVKADGVNYLKWLDEMLSNQGDIFYRDVDEYFLVKLVI